MYRNKFSRSRMATLILYWLVFALAGERNYVLASKSDNQDKKLTNRFVEQFAKQTGVDLHDGQTKPNARYDLYRKPNGDIVVKPKGGKGPGEPTGYNVNDISFARNSPPQNTERPKNQPQDNHASSRQAQAKQLGGVTINVQPQLQKTNAKNDFPVIRDSRPSDEAVTWDYQSRKSTK